jgi:hypothetical protein
MRGSNIIGDLRARTARPAQPPPAHLTPEPPPVEITDDYIVEREVEEHRPPVGAQALRIAQNLMLVVLAAISLALFVLVALLLGIF